MGKVILFSISGCQACKAAKGLLQRFGAKYVDVLLDGADEKMMLLAKETGTRTVPQIYFNNRHIGGLDQLEKLSTDGLLITMLQETLNSTEDFTQYHLLPVKKDGNFYIDNILSTNANLNNNGNHRWGHQEVKKIESKDTNSKMHAVPCDSNNSNTNNGNGSGLLDSNTNNIVENGVDQPIAAVFQSDGGNDNKQPRPQSLNLQQEHTEHNYSFSTSSPSTSSSSTLSYDTGTPPTSSLSSSPSSSCTSSACFLPVRSKNQENVKTNDVPHVKNEREIEKLNIMNQMNELNEWSEMFETTPSLEMLLLQIRFSHKPFLARDRWIYFKKHRKCFTGKELVNWLIENNHVNSVAQAMEVGQQLLRYEVIRRIVKPANYSFEFEGESALYRFQWDFYQPLNMTRIFKGKSKPADIVGENLRVLLLQLYDTYLSNDGSSFDYKSASNDKLFHRYVTLTCELQRVHLESLSTNEQKALFINLYNSLVIHSTIVYGTPANILSRIQFFKKHGYNIGGNFYSLDDMENGILRANRKSPSSLSPPFGPTDNRLCYALPAVDPRIHFALVCGAKSCPPIKVYNAKNIDQTLTLATEAYIENNTSIDVPNRTIFLSKLFSWYGIDFGGTPLNILKWILGYVHKPDMRKELEKLFLELTNGVDVKIKFSHYDWTLNQI